MFARALPLLALSKEMGSGKIRFKGRQPFAFGYFLQEQKVPRRQAKPDSSARAFLTLRLSRRPAFVLAKFAWLRFRLTAKTALAALLVLSP